MESNKWELKSHSYQIADTGDYDGYWEITDGKISLCTKDDPADERLEDVVKALNATECKFYVNNDDEVINLQLENYQLKDDYAALCAKVESCKSALNEAKDTINWMWKHMKEADGQTLLQVDVFNRPANALHIIDSVIEQEGEKEPVPQQVFPENEYGYVTMDNEDNEELDKAQERGCMLEMALFQAGYKKGKKAIVQQQGSVTSVYVPCLEDDPRVCGGYTSTDGQSLCYVRESNVPVVEGPVIGMDEVIGFAEWAAEFAFFDDGTRLWEFYEEEKRIEGQFRFSSNEFFELYQKQNGCKGKEVKP